VTVLDSKVGLDKLTAAAVGGAVKKWNLFWNILTIPVHQVKFKLRKHHSGWVIVFERLLSIGTVRAFNEDFVKIITGGVQNKDENCVYVCA